jgi:hypothetical protein
LGVGRAAASGNGSEPRDFAEQAADEADIAKATARALDKATAWMAAHNYPVKALSTQTVDMSTVPLGKRGRREAARKDQ